MPAIDSSTNGCCGYSLLSSIVASFRASVKDS